MFTDADFEAVIAQANVRGRPLDDEDARMFLMAKDILADQPSHAAAQIVVENFKRYMLTGIRVESLSEFLLPIPYTKAARAEIERQRNEFVEFYRKMALVGIAEGDYNAAVAWRNQHSLTSRQILEMSDSEIVQRA